MRGRLIPQLRKWSCGIISKLKVCQFAWINSFIFIQGFTRTLSSVYLTTYLILFIHTQLNILGRFIYLDSVEDLKLKHSSEDLSSIGM